MIIIATNIIDYSEVSSFIEKKFQDTLITMECSTMNYCVTIL